MDNNTKKYIQTLQEIGPIAWAEGPNGWVTDDGNALVLIDWQRAALQAWWENRNEVSTFAISNIKKTGKTMLNAVFLAWRWLALPGQHFAAGNDLDQAQARQFAMIAEMVKRNQFLNDNVKIGKTELVFLLTDSKLTALAADAAGNAGANQITSSHTEAWGILYESAARAWEELTPVPGRFYGLPSLRIADSYAGFIGESKTWHKLVDRGLKGDPIPGEWQVFKDGGLLLFHMEGIEAQERCFRGTEAERIDYYREQAEILRENAFTRMHLNQRTSGESAFVTEEQWQACIDPDLHPLQSYESVNLYLGADASTSHDHTALVGVTAGSNGVEVRFVKVWKPRTIAGIRMGKPTIDIEATIGQEVLNLHDAGLVSCVVYDPFQMHSVAVGWEKAGVRCIEMPQTTQRVEADTALFNAINSGHIRSFDSLELTEAVRNAVVIETPRGIRLAKEKASRKIDPLVALSMANYYAIGRRFESEVTRMPNIFYGEFEGKDVERDFLTFPDGTFIHSPGKAKNKHPPGVTWETCKKRNKGCEACVAELEALGFYKQQELEAEARKQQGVPDYQQMALNQMLLDQQLMKGQENNVQQLQHFWQTAKRLARNGKDPTNSQ